MRLFSVTAGEVHSLSPVPFAADHLEAQIQSWADAFPALINGGYPMVSLGCEILTEHRKSIDNLFIDGDGVLVVAEMKRGKSPYDVLAQTATYGAFVRGLDWSKIDTLCEDRNGADIASAFQTTFGRALIREPKPRHRLLIVAESFDPWIMDGASYLIDTGVPLVLLQFQLFKIGDQSLLQLNAVQGELPEQERPPLVLAKSKQTDEGYAGWLMSSIGGKLGEIGEAQGWPLSYEIKQKSVPFHSQEWPLTLADCQFRVDLYRRDALALRFSFRSALAPGLEDMLKAQQARWNLGFPATVERPSYEAAFVTMTFNKSRPRIGDEGQVSDTMGSIAQMTSALRPIVDDYFAESQKPMR